MGKPIPGLSPELRSQSTSCVLPLGGAWWRGVALCSAALCRTIVSSRRAVAKNHECFATIGRSSRLSPTFSRRSCGSGRILRCFPSQLFVSPCSFRGGSGTLRPAGTGACQAWQCSELRKSSVKEQRTAQASPHCWKGLRLWSDAQAWPAGVPCLLM